MTMLETQASFDSMGVVEPYSSPSFKDFDKKFCVVNSCGTTFALAQEMLYHRQPADDVIHKCNPNGLWHESFAVKKRSFILGMPENLSSSHLFANTTPCASRQGENKPVHVGQGQGQVGTTLETSKTNDRWWFTAPLQTTHDGRMDTASSFHVVGHIPAYSKTNHNVKQALEIESTVSSSTSSGSSWETFSFVQHGTVVITHHNDDDGDKDKATHGCNGSIVSSLHSDAESTNGGNDEDEDSDQGTTFEFFDDVSVLTEEGDFDVDVHVDEEDNAFASNETSGDEEGDTDVDDVEEEDQVPACEELVGNELGDIDADVEGEEEDQVLACEELLGNEVGDLEADADVHVEEEGQVPAWEELLGYEEGDLDADFDNDNVAPAFDAPSVNNVARAMEDSQMIEFLLSYCMEPKR